MRQIAKLIKKVASNNICQYKPKYLAEKAKPMSTALDKPLRSTRAHKQNSAMNPPDRANIVLSTEGGAAKAASFKLSVCMVMMFLLLSLLILIE